MNVKLFYCGDCKRFSTQASAIVSYRDTVNISQGRLSLGSEDMYEGQVEAVGFVCYGCDGERVEIVELKECPHDWQPSGYGYRRCEFCGKKQEGKVVFDE